ncbi:MAG: hypothetical protein GX638_15405 [Crenarchaeota archaeon]|jgi:hypothetical protein|nr:hypothetical protein [Thermoproteota archaeon]
MDKNKCIIEVYIPAVLKRFDVVVNPKSKMYVIQILILKLVGDLLDGCYLPSDNSIFVNFENGEIYDINMTAEEQDISNGSCLMLL